MPDEPFDWAAAGRTFIEMEARLVREASDLHGAEFYAEALRRLWARIGHGWVPQAEMMRILDMNRAVDRASGERAQATLAHFTAEYERKMADSAHQYAAALRARCNERTVTSRLRREGVLLAADWLDGKAS
jgi:hypothetical protein